MPQRQREFVALYDKARKLYGAARSTDARQSARAGLQIDVHRFLGLTHSAADWTGIVRQTTTSPSGNLALTIEIHPGVSVSTWLNDYDDKAHHTMFRPKEPLTPVVQSLTIGQPVRFSAELVGSVVSTDEEMVLHPRIIARFARITPIADSGTP